MGILLDDLQPILNQQFIALDFILDVQLQVEVLIAQQHD